MNPTRFSRDFYSTPYYTPTDHAAPIFAVRSLHVLPRHFPSRGHALAKRRSVMTPNARVADLLSSAKS